VDRSRSRRIQQLKRRGKTQGAMVVSGMLMPISRREGTSASGMLAELGESEIVDGGGVG